MVFSAAEVKTALDVAIGNILTKTSETTVKNVIGSYSYENSASENIEQLKTHNRTDLSDTHKFLRNLSTEYPASAQFINHQSRTIPKYAEDIVKFIDNLKPTLCPVCNDNYVPTIDDYGEGKVNCFLCERPSHHHCYNDMNINPEIGVIYICSECLSVNAAKKLSDKISHEDKKNESPPKEPEEEESAKTDEEREIKIVKTTEGANTQQPSREFQRSDEDCPLYAKRQCPHGLTGKREIEGRPCPYRHRRLCDYFKEKGPEGCKFGRRCRYFHPPVCQNSLNLQTCLNRDCYSYHLPGTSRKPYFPVSSSNHQQKPPQARVTTNTIKPWFAPNETHHSNKPEMFEEKKQPSSSELSRDFLVKQMESMKADLFNYTSKLIQNSIKENLPRLVPTFQNQQPQHLILQENQPTQLHFKPDNRPEDFQTQKRDVNQLPTHQQNFQYSQLIPVQTYQPHQMPSSCQPVHG